MADLIKYAVGIDIAKDKFDACFSEIDLNQQFKIKSSHQFANHIKGFKAFEQWLQKHQKQQILMVILMEATGIYYEKLAFYLHRNSFSVVIVLPNKAKKYMQALGLKSKNDKVDARGLAQMAAEQKLDLWQPMGNYFYQLRQLTRHHEQLQVSKTMFKNQLLALENGAIEAKVVVRQQKKVIALIDKQIKETIIAIEKLINSNKEVMQKVENICKIKGLGLITVATVIAETNGFELFKNIRQLVSFSGYDVVENQSGNHSGKTKISKKGNSHIRRILHMPSFCVVRFNQKPFVDLFNRVYTKTTFKMKGYVAVQKKLLIYIYTLWKKNEPFELKQDKTSGNDEPKPIFLLGSEGDILERKTVQKKIVPIKTGTTQDKLPCNESPEAFFLLTQN